MKTRLDTYEFIRQSCGLGGQYIYLDAHTKKASSLFKHSTRAREHGIKYTWNTYTNAQVRNVHIVCKYKYGEAVVRLDSLRPKHLESTIPRTRNKQTCSNRSKPINELHINDSYSFEHQMINMIRMNKRSRDECITIPFINIHNVSIDRIHKHQTRRERRHSSSLQT